MASIITDKWVSTSPQVKFIVDVKENTATYVTYSWTVQYIAQYAASTNSARSWTAKIDDGTASGTYSINGKTGTNTIKTGTKKVYKGTSAKTINYSVSMNIDLTWSGVKKSTISKSGTLSVGAKTSYKVTYNANGGSGAPSAQTKWHGTNLTLSSTKPTKSGYTFLGWSTNKSATSATYAAGATYSSNAAVTLYAIWRKTITVSYSANGGSIGSIANQTAYAYNSATSVSITLSNASGPTKSGYTFLGWSTNKAATSATYSKGKAYTFSSSVTLYAIWRKTITVTYNANGGSGAPSASTNYVYNGTTSKEITLSTTVPTLTNYNFLGWSINKDATTATYAAGAKVTLSSSTTLYAIWEADYIKPRISNLSVIRCDINGEEADDGTFARIWFNAETDELPSSAVVTYVINGEEKSDNLLIATAIPSETNGKTTYSVEPKSNATCLLGMTLTDANGLGPFSPEVEYIFSLTITDAGGNNTVTYTVKPMRLALDLYRGGGGIAFGKPADKEGLECEFDAYFNSKLTSNIFLGNNIGDYSSSKIIILPEISNVAMNTLYGTTGTNDDTYFQNLLKWICKNYPNKGHYIYIGKVNPNSTGTVIISIYNTSNVDASTGLPQYSSGLYIRLQKSTVNFGTYSYRYYSSTPLLTSGGTISGALTVSGATTLRDQVYMTKNDAIIYGRTTTGKDYEAFVPCTQTDNVAIGYGLYTAGLNQTNIYGNIIQLTAKAGIKFSGYIGSSVLLGTGTAADNNRYYFNNNGTGRFNGLRYTSIAAISSARRYKENIDYKDVDYWHEGLMRVKPCTYNYISGEDKNIKIGVIAEDLAECLPELVEFNENGECETVYYIDFIIPLVAESQLQDKRITELENIVEEQQTQINELKALVEEQQTQINELKALVEEQQTQINELKALVQQLLDK